MTFEDCSGFSRLEQGENCTTACAGKVLNGGAAAGTGEPAFTVGQIIYPRLYLANTHARLSLNTKNREQPSSADVKERSQTCVHMETIRDVKRTFARRTGKKRRTGKRTQHGSRDDDLYVLPLFLNRRHVIDIFSPARTQPFT
jgi:hypothetical protein